jgi:hypothetical protein
MLSAARAPLRRLSPDESYEAVAKTEAILVDIRPESQRAIEGSIAGAPQLCRILDSAARRTWLADLMLGAQRVCRLCRQARFPRTGLLLMSGRKNDRSALSALCRPCSDSQSSGSATGGERVYRAKGFFAHFRILSAGPSYWMSDRTPPEHSKAHFRAPRKRSRRS